MLFRVKGTRYKRLQWIQRRFVTLVAFWLLLFCGFRGDTGAVLKPSTPLVRELRYEFLRSNCMPR